MKLSAYIKLQKILLTAFFVSVGVLVFTSFFAFNSDITAVNTANARPNIASPTQTAIPANAVTPTKPPINTVKNIPVNVNSKNNSAVNVNAASNTAVNINNNSVVIPPENPKEESGYGLMIIGGVSFLTSITSLLGFISTTVLAWRKEKRETEVIRFDNEKKELELEKLKWELEKMKAAEAEKKTKPKRRKPKPTE